MKTTTFTMANETEATALVKFFGDCGISANRKGNSVKASGEPDIVSYLYEKFLTIALI